MKTKMKMRMKVKAVTLGEIHIEKVSEVALEYGVNFSEMLRRIVDDYYEARKNDQNGKNRELAEKSKAN